MEGADSLAFVNGVSGILWHKLRYASPVKVPFSHRPDENNNNSKNAGAISKQV